MLGSGETREEGFRTSLAVSAGRDWRQEGLVLYWPPSELSGWPGLLLAPVWFASTGRVVVAGHFPSMFPGKALVPWVFVAVEWVVQIQVPRRIAVPLVED